jgi:hypothetical protein
MVEERAPFMTRLPRWFPVRGMSEEECAAFLCNSIRVCLVMPSVLFGARIKAVSGGAGGR